MPLVTGGVGRSASGVPNSIVTRNQEASGSAESANVQSLEGRDKVDVRSDGKPPSSGKLISALDPVTTVTAQVHLPSVMVQSISLMFSAATG